MEKLNFVTDGAMRLPPGFRFQPTDEELVFQYLKRKVFGCPLPASIIPEINICKYDPWDLPGDSSQDRYFFGSKEVKYRNGNRTNRATGSGYWKATGVDRRVTSRRGNPMVGMKKTLVFHRGKSPHGSRTDWIMHEYRLVSAGTSRAKNSTQNSLIQMEGWVVCRIFLKKRAIKSEEEIIKTGMHMEVMRNVGVSGPRYYDFVEGNGTGLGGCLSHPSSPSLLSSGSSGITD